MEKPLLTSREIGQLAPIQARPDSLTASLTAASCHRWEACVLLWDAIGAKYFPGLVQFVDVFIPSLVSDLAAARSAASAAKDAAKANPTPAAIDAAKAAEDYSQRCNALIRVEVDRMGSLSDNGTEGWAMGLNGVLYPARMSLIPKGLLRELAQFATQIKALIFKSAWRHHSIVCASLVRYWVDFHQDDTTCVACAKELPSDSDSLSHASDQSYAPSDRSNEDDILTIDDEEEAQLHIEDDVAGGEVDAEIDVVIALEAAHAVCADVYCCHRPCRCTLLIGKSAPGTRYSSSPWIKHSPYSIYPQFVGHDPDEEAALEVFLRSRTAMPCLRASSFSADSRYPIYGVR